MLKAHPINADTLTVVFGAWKSQTATYSYSNMVSNRSAHLSFSFGFWTVRVTNTLKAVQKTLRSITE